MRRPTKEIAGTRELGRKNPVLPTETRINHAVDRLISESERLKTIQEEIEECIEDDEFECESYKLSLGKLSQYRNDTVFSMNNPVVIGDVINCVLNRINAKMDKLKTEIAC